MEPPAKSVWKTLFNLLSFAQYGPAYGIRLHMLPCKAPYIFNGWLVSKLTTYSTHWIGGLVSKLTTYGTHRIGGLVPSFIIHSTSYNGGLVLNATGSGAYNSPTKALQVGETSSADSPKEVQV